ncbi:MAG: phosphatase PAP2 family protein [Gemmatimonadaceae bacterium]
MRSNVVVAVGSLLLISNTAAAQKDSLSQKTSAPRPAAAWLVPVGIVAASTLDAEFREWSQGGHTRFLDQLANSINPLGTAHVLVPAIAVTYVGALLTGHESLASGTLKTAAAYAASDLVESALKPMIGRQRPHVEGNSHHFHPFTANGDWHSFPSAHVAHITALAEAISLQAHSAPISTLCGSLVALVAWDRIYEDQHWTSDVTATMALSSVVSAATIRWLESHWHH